MPDFVFTMTCPYVGKSYDVTLRHLLSGFRNEVKAECPDPSGVAGDVRPFLPAGDPPPQ
jgi:hypothetical protein